MTTRTSTTKSTAPVAAEMTADEATAILLASPLGEALKALLGGSTVAQEVAAEAPAKVSTVKTFEDKTLEFLEAKNLGFAKGGRAYFTKETVEAISRVMKTGKPEVVASPEGTRTAGLLIARDDKGNTYSQNVRNL